MSDFSLDGLIDDLAVALQQARHEAGQRVQARCLRAVTEAAGLSVADWHGGAEHCHALHTLVAPQGLRGMEMEVALCCQLEETGGRRNMPDGLALRVCAPGQGHVLRINLSGNEPTLVTVHLDAHLLRSFGWQGRHVHGGAGNG